MPPAFNTFQPVTEDEVRKCINESPTKSCLLDPIPTFLLRDCLDILLPSITKLVNYSLSDGSFPSAFKRAVVTPLIKKASLPKNDLKNYRPVSVCKVFRTPLLVLLQIIESMLMLHPFYRNSTGCLLSIVVFSKPQHLCINFCIVVLLLTSNRSCLLVVVPIALGIVTQIVNTLQFLLFIHQSLSQPNILAIVLPLMLLRSGMTSLKMFAVQHQLPPSERSLKLTCLQKPTHHSLSRHICVSLVRPGYVPWLTITALLYV